MLGSRCRCAAAGTSLLPIKLSQTCTLMPFVIRLAITNGRYMCYVGAQAMLCDFRSVGTSRLLQTVYQGKCYKLTEYLSLMNDINGHQSRHAQFRAYKQVLQVAGSTRSHSGPHHVFHWLLDRTRRATRLLVRSLASREVHYRTRRQHCHSYGKDRR